MRRQMIALVTCALAAIAFAASPASAQDWPPFAGPASPGLEHGPMRLGHPMERWPSPRDQATAARRDTGHRCQTWRRVAGRLGETYAGYKVRQDVVKKLCGLAGHARARTWGWPWSGLANGQLLPPRSHRHSGQWQIRCGRGAWRRRCAALQIAPAAPGRSPSPGAPEVVTHFVIDTVAGRESLLWRVFIPADAGRAPVRAERDRGRLAKPRQVRYWLGGRIVSLAFTTCAKAGCVVESGPQRSGDVASALSDGRAIELEARMPGGHVVMVDIPAEGFRGALHELMRLRRIEHAATQR